jgi:hypothetical protein
MVIIFDKPDQAQVKEWYKWMFSLNNQKNPFHPTKGGQYWDVNNTNQNSIWLAGVIATTAPANQPSQISNLKAIVQVSQANVVYNDGNGNPVQKLPSISPRDISLNKGDDRDLLIPVSTELAHERKYPKLANNLSALAQEIIDRENANGIPPAFVEFEDAGKNKESLNGNQLKTGFRVNGSFDNLNVPPDNVGMIPQGNGRAAFSDYSVILKHDALKPGKNTLKFGVNGQFFTYTVVYTINM